MSLTKILDTIKNLYQKYSLIGILRILIYRLIATRILNNFLKPFIQRTFANKKGLEIGGATAIFMSKSVLPVYRIAKQIDNCNFASETVWKNSISEGYTFNYEKSKVGYQYINEATDLKNIADKAYDFVLSSNTLEHTANPILALQEIKRVLKENGYLLLLLPHKFGALASDQIRKPTALSHMIFDFENHFSENDLTVMQEVIKIHNELGDWTRNDYDKYIVSAKDNFLHRCLHHHVFIVQNSLELVNYVGFQVCFAMVYPPSDIILLCKKTSLKDNTIFLSRHAAWHKLSPYKVDH